MLKEELNSAVWFLSESYMRRLIDAHVALSIELELEAISLA